MGSLLVSRKITHFNERLTSGSFTMATGREPVPRRLQYNLHYAQKRL